MRQARPGTAPSAARDLLQKPPMAFPVPPCMGPVGPECWKEATLDVVRLARELSQKTGRAATACWHPSHPRKSPPEDMPCSQEEEVLPAEMRPPTGLGTCAVDTGKIQEERMRDAPCSADWSRRITGPPWMTKLPLPFFRDYILMQNNGLIHEYARDTREVVAHLHQAIGETNEEVKMLLKQKDALDHAHANIRKDLLVNKQSVTLRSFRPECEKEPDMADTLLRLERTQLLTLKVKLEEELLLTQEQLQTLGSCRRALSDCAQERTRVLDLINHSLTTVLRANEKEARLSSNPLLANRPQARWGGERNATPRVSPLGPFSPECKEALEVAKCACQRSKELRRDIKEVLAEVVGLQQALDKCVNESLRRKMGETDTLKGLLHLTKGEMRQSLHRCQRLYDEMDKTHGLAQGPVSSRDLLVQQRLDRPMVRVYQRHAGTQMPETTMLTQGGLVLQRAMKATSDDIGLLHITGLRMEDNLRDKGMAYRVDSSVSRLRHRRAPHRWTMDEGKQLICN